MSSLMQYGIAICNMVSRRYALKILFVLLMLPLPFVIRLMFILETPIKHIHEFYGELGEKHAILYQTSSKLPTLPRNQSEPQCPRALNKKKYERYTKLLKEVTKFYRTHNITYFMADGTLLGSYLFHDVIPWDDDLDLMVRLEDYPRLKQIYR